MTDVDKEIGKVTKYSDEEGTYSGNFSNTYKKGTKYFRISGINIDEAIAIEEDGQYRKAYQVGKYGKKYNINNLEMTKIKQQRLLIMKGNYLYGN